MRAEVLRSGGVSISGSSEEVSQQQEKPLMEATRSKSTFKRRIFGIIGPVCIGGFGLDNGIPKEAKQQLDSHPQTGAAAECPCAGSI